MITKVPNSMLVSPGGTGTLANNLTQPTPAVAALDAAQGPALTTLISSKADATATANALATKITDLGTYALGSGTTNVTHAAHANIQGHCAQAGATSWVFAATGTSGALARDSFYCLNDGAGTATMSGAISAPAGFTLSVPPGVAGTADYSAVLDVWFSTTPSAVASGGAPVTVSGSTAMGSILTAVIGAGWVSASGNWTRNGTNISGATSLTYTTVVADVGTSVTYAAAMPTAVIYIPTGISVVATIPGAPTSLAAGSATSTTQPLTWTAPASNGGSALTDYTIEFSSNGGTTWTPFAHTASTTASITVTGLTASTSYMYRVSAKNAIGTGVPSSTVTNSTTSASGVSDNFTRANGAIGTSSSGTVWSVLAGSPVITSNRAHFDGVSEAVIESSLSDFTLTYVGNSNLAGFPYVSFRGNGVTQNYLVVAIGASGQINLCSYVSGTFAAIGAASANGVIPVSADFTMQVICSGTSIIVKVGGTTILTQTSSLFLTATKVGFQDGGGGFFQIASLTVA